MPHPQQRPTPHLNRSRWGLIGALFLASWLSWLSGCGPGVGGTGTGETNGLAAFGAAPAALCAADAGGVLGGALGDVLGCVASAGVASPSPVPGAAPLMLADTTLSPRVQARLQDNAIDLMVPCTGLRFRGQWGLAAGQTARFFGHTGLDGALQPATLQMERGPAGAASVVITLRDAAGAVLLGPTGMLVVPAAATPGACN